MKATRMREYRKLLVLDDVPVPDTQALASQYGADHVISTEGKPADDIRQELTEATVPAGLETIGARR